MRKVLKRLYVQIIVASCIGNDVVVDLWNFRGGWTYMICSGWAYMRRVLKCTEASSILVALYN